MTALPRVALAGFYGHGNFGDDLVAAMLGRYLTSIGIPFSVYRLCAPYAQRFSLPVKHSAEELIEGANVLLWGGGGLLVSWPRSIYGLLFPKVSGEASRLVSLALQRKMRLLGVSIGGDGTSSGELNPAYKQQFVRAAEYLTVRNPQDLEVVKRLGVKATFFPDIVWQATKWFPARRTVTGRLRIGVDLYPGSLLRQNAAHLIPLLLAVACARRDCEFVFIDTSNKSCRSQRGVGLFMRGNNVRVHQFHDMQEDLDLFASLDLLVSSRLHAPIICLQCGVPVLSLFAEKKTLLMFRNLGLAHLCYGKGRVCEFLALMRDRKEMERFIRGFQFPDVESLRSKSEGHMQFLRERLCGAQTE